MSGLVVVTYILTFIAFHDLEDAINTSVQPNEEVKSSVNVKVHRWSPWDSWFSGFCCISATLLSKPCSYFHYSFINSCIYLFFTSVSLTQPKNQRHPLSHYHSFETRWRSGNKRETRLNPFKSVHMSDFFYQYSEAPEICAVIFVQPGSIDLQSVTGEKQSHVIGDCH